MRYLLIAWCAAFLVVAAITLRFRRETTSFYGIAETRESVINSRDPVELKRLHVVPGQEVKRGDTLVELSRPDLTMKINEISHMLNELLAKDMDALTALRSEINQIEARKAALVNGFQAKIQELRSRYEMNRQLTAGLKSIDAVVSADSIARKSNPVLAQIEILQKEMAHESAPLRLKIDQLRSQLLVPNDAAGIRVEQLRKELLLLEEEQSKLVIRAQIEGLIGALNYKEGEKISPFEPILTLHTKSPSYIEGYVHENVYNRVKLGERVVVTSMSDKRNSTPGEVTGIGARIVEYPVRLRKHPDLQMWGREVHVKIPESNSFLLGEKVIVTFARDARRSGT